ncbi:GNAT family N-acetyltransferase [Ruegeria sp. 2012CJ41-6]|uniref:GNAT family N-acetyltransferase n=1 Tax=Ruegeria spongiae TaxID=2942209 RepID=A0ABT0Q5K9_9RHOB|nr:GNAT family N-acetyltransferase [Ruegeria spongiae]MCL6285158.1 GNAT family N-acetyltransferase [Ruegeria spongiae]
MADLVIHTASMANRTALRLMQAHAMRQLGADFYPRNAVDAFISEIGTMDDHLIEDGTYFIASLGGILVGAGGWSMRQASYSRCNSVDDPAASVPKATVRSVYVHPTWARRGIGGKLMKRIEQSILAAGFANASLTATLSGVPLYQHLGYRSGRPVNLSLPGGVNFGALEMAKPLSGPILKQDVAV